MAAIHLEFGLNPSRFFRGKFETDSRQIRDRFKGHEINRTTTRQAIATIAIVSLMAIAYFFAIRKKPQENEPLHSVASGHLRMTAEAFSATHPNNDAAFNQEFKGREIELSGEMSQVREATDGGYYLILRTSSVFGGIGCHFDSASDLGNLQSGHTVKVRGVCESRLSLSRCEFLGKVITNELNNNLNQDEARRVERYRFTTGLTAAGGGLSEAYWLTRKMEQPSP